MLKSMTGFGRAEQTVGGKTFLVDIKSLNGKQFELQVKMPAFLKPFEFEIRKVLSEGLGRGTVDCMISLKETGNAKPITINTDLAKAYYQPLSQLAAELRKALEQSVYVRRHYETRRYALQARGYATGSSSKLRNASSSESVVLKTVARRVIESKSTFLFVRRSSVRPPVVFASEL